MGIALIGKLAWSAFGWAMPGIGPKTAYVVAALAILAMVGSVGFMQGREGKAAAVVAADARCEVRIAEVQTVSATTMTTLLDRIAKDETASEPKTSAEEAALCKKSKLCRGAK